MYRKYPSCYNVSERGGGCAGGTWIHDFSIFLILGLSHITVYDLKMKNCNTKPLENHVKRKPYKNITAEKEIQAINRGLI